MVGTDEGICARLRRRAGGGEDGVALLVAVGVLAVLLVVAGLAIGYSQENAQMSTFSQRSSRAQNLAEAGVNRAMAIISNPGANLTSPTLLSQRTETIDGGTVVWSGAYDATYARWTISSTGSVENPTGAADVTRTATAKVWVANTVFTSTRPTGDGTNDREIWVMNLDGTGAYPLTANNWEDGDAFWSPDTGTFVYETEKDSDALTGAGLGYGPTASATTNRDIYSMRVDGSHNTRLTTNAGRANWAGSSADEDAQWGPNGKMVFDSLRNGHSNSAPSGDAANVYQNNWDVYIMSADGTNQQNLTPCVPDNPATTGTNEANFWTKASDPTKCSDDQEPAYGPGGKVCIQTAKNGNADLAVMALTVDGSGNVTSGSPSIAAGGANEQRECDWSPDGTKIAFMENVGGGDYEIMVVNADGTGKTQITNNTVNDEHPGWAPDGRIVFNSSITTGADNSNNADGGEEMFIMNANGTGIHQLSVTGAGVENRFPDVRGMFVPYDFTS